MKSAEEWNKDCTRFLEGLTQQERTAFFGGTMEAPDDIRKALGELSNEQINYIQAWLESCAYAEIGKLIAKQIKYGETS